MPWQRAVQNMASCLQSPSASNDYMKKGSSQILDPYALDQKRKKTQKTKQSSVLRCLSSLWTIGASQVMLVVNNLPANAGDTREVSLIPGWGRLPWRRSWQATPVFLPEESHGQRRLAGYSP